MIKNIVFDMGNVLTIYHQKEYIYQYVDNEEDFRWIKNQLCTSVEWLQMDRGSITDEEAIVSVCKRLPMHLHSVARRFINEFRMNHAPNPPMEQLVKDLSQRGYSLYLLSNTSCRFRKFCKCIRSIDYMDGIWISCEHGFLKPEREAYFSFFKTFGLEPQECFFIDDMPANIEAAANVGMAGCVYYGDVEELRMVLKSNGVNL